LRQKKFFSILVIVSVVAFITAPSASTEPKGTLVMFHAGSLTMPFATMEKEFEARYCG